MLHLRFCAVSPVVVQNLPNTLWFQFQEVHFSEVLVLCFWTGPAVPHAFSFHTKLDKTDKREVLKQHSVTLTATHCFKKRNLTMHVNTFAQNGNASKIRSYFTEKVSSGFPSDVWRLLCLSGAFYFSGAVTSNDPVQLWSFVLLSGTSVNHRVEAEQS